MTNLNPTTENNIMYMYLCPMYMHALIHVKMASLFYVHVYIHMILF